MKYSVIRYNTIKNTTYNNHLVNDFRSALQIAIDAARVEQDVVRVPVRRHPHPFHALKRSPRQLIVPPAPRERRHQRVEHDDIRGDLIK